MSDVISNDAPSNHNQLAVPPSEQDHRQGSLNARVVLVEYGDYQCPQCGELYLSIRAIQRQLEAALYGRDFLCFVCRYFPQPQIHPQAQVAAAAAAAAAAAQGQFWQMYEILLEHQQELGNGYLAEYADRLGLNVPQFLRDIARGTHLDRINQDIESGIHGGVTTTPTLFINGNQYTGHWNTTELMAAMITASH